MNKKEEQETIKKEKIIFGVDLPIDGLHFLQNVVYTNVISGNLNFTLTAALLQGLNLLKKKHPKIPQLEFIEKRNYKGGRQSKKGEVVRTSLICSTDDKKWIDNYIVFKLKGDIYFSKISFINDLIEELKISYEDKLVKIPNREQ